MLASKNAIARLTTTRTNTIGYILWYICTCHWHILSVRRARRSDAKDQFFKSLIAGRFYLYSSKEIQKNGNTIGDLLPAGLKVSLLQNAALH